MRPFTGMARQFAPGKLGMPVVCQMQVVVEENRPQPTRHAQVPRAVFAVERREGMVGVLQRTPGKAEGGIAGISSNHEKYLTGG